MKVVTTVRKNGIEGLSEMRFCSVVGYDNENSDTIKAMRL